MILGRYYDGGELVGVVPAGETIGDLHELGGDWLETPFLNRGIIWPAKCR